MKDVLQIVALILGFLGIVADFTSLHVSTWRGSSDFDNVIVTSRLFENLWMSCAEDSTGVYNCWYFQSLLALPVHIMNSVVEAAALFLGFMGWIMDGVALPNRFWKVSTVDGNVITTSTIYENLWMSCATDSTGVHNCREFPSLLGLSGYVQACRALMIASIVIGTFGLIATLVGMQCSKIGGENYVLKGRIAALAGVFFILQGLCTMIAVSWYAANITREFFDPLFPGTKYEIGEGLYIGWSSGTLALCGGCCLLCSCKVGSKEDKMSYKPHSTTRVPAYAASAMTRTPSSQYGRNAYV